MGYTFGKQQSPPLGGKRNVPPTAPQPPAVTGNPYSVGSGLGGRSGLGTSSFNYGKRPTFGNPNTLSGRGAGMYQPKPPEPPPNPRGTESGPTYLEDRYLQRLYGNDPAFNYASKRGMEELGNRSAAAGNFNSGAARQQESDFYANLVAQQQGQLDALAAGATGARQNKVDSMFRSGLGLAGGESGVNSAYDLAAGSSMSDALAALLGFMTNKAGVDSKSNQQGIQNLIGLGSLFA